MSITLLAADALSGIHHLSSSLAVFQPDAIDSGNARTLTWFVVIAGVALASQAVAIVAIAFVVFKLRTEVITHITDIKAKVMPFVAKSEVLVDDLTPQVKNITAKVQTLVTDLSPTIKGITVKTESLLTELSPQIVAITAKVQTITGHVEEMSGLARDKVNEFGPTLTQANETAKHSIAITRETVDRTNEVVRATVDDVNGKALAQVSRFNGLVSDALDATAKLGKALEYGVTKPAREVAGFASGAKVTIEHLLKNYGGLFKFGSRSKSAPATPPIPPRRAVVPHAPESMGNVRPFGSAVERDLDL